VHDAGTLLWIAALHIVWTGLPLVAAMLLAARLGVKGVPTLLAVGLVASGVTAITAFWAYFAAPSLGRFCSYAIAAGSIAIAVWSARGIRSRGELLRRTGTPLALWALGVLFLVFLGFVHGGTDDPLPMATQRFSHPLPSDNALPFYFGDWFNTHGHDGVAPAIGDALSSDRPPLQTGYALEERVFDWDDAALHYEVLGVALQQLWIIGLWALLVAWGVRLFTRALILAAVLIGDVAIVHGFYVWPKLLSASFLIAAAGFLLIRSSEERDRTGVAVLVAALFALALLSHGTALFGIIALAVVTAARGLPPWRWLVLAAVVGATLLVPWSLYQRYVDPPGNRLAKEAFAGLATVDTRSTPQAVVDSYREAGIGGTVDNKVRNFRAMTVGEEPNTVGYLSRSLRLAASGDFSEAIRAARGARFFSLLLSLGLFVLAPLAMLLARVRRRPESEDWSFGVTCLGCVAVGCLLWGLLFFGPAQTLNHQGSFALPVLAVAGAVAGLRAAYPRLAVAIVAVNAAIVLLLYAPVLDPPRGTRFSALALGVSAVCLFLYLAVAFRSRDAARTARSCAGAPSR
jgi:hypothetical protein